MATITKTQQSKAGAKKNKSSKKARIPRFKLPRGFKGGTAGFVPPAVMAPSPGSVEKLKAIDAARTPLGQALEQGLREAVSIAKGEADAPRRFSLTEFRNAFVHKAFGPVEIRDLRKKLGLSQSMLAAVMDLTPRSVTNWEQGLRTPDGPSRRMLQLLEVKPEVLKFLLGEAATGGSER